MPQVSKCILAMWVMIFLLTLPACAPKSKVVEKDAPVIAGIAGETAGLELDESQAPTLIYKRPGAPTLAAYNRFIINQVQVDYSDPKMKELDPKDVGKMQQYFRDAMIKELQEAGYEVGTRAEAETLRISFTISGLKAPKGGGAANVATMAAGAAVGLPIIFAVSVGEVTVKGVFREALTNRIDAVVVTRSAGSRAFNPKPWSTWADVEGTFDKWAKGFREAVDKAHGR